MKNWESLPHFRPSSQEEIFYRMTNDSGVIEPFRSKMFDCGAIQIRIRNSARKISICGTNDVASFFDDFQIIFQAHGDVENLAHVLEYSGGFKIGSFQSDTIYSGNCLSELENLPFSTAKGTIGGFFHDETYTYIITAAHTISMD